MANYNPGRDPNLPARVRRALRRAGIASKYLSQGQTTVTSVASATTVNLNYTTGELVLITGTTTITGFEVANEGEWRYVEFDDSLTLVHNATSFILPGGFPIVTLEGDTADFVSLGEGNWKCTNYERYAAPGSPLYNGLWADYIADHSTLTVAVTYNNGSSGAGATLTGNTFGAISIFGFGTPALGSLILLNDDGTLSGAGGIWEITTKGAGGVYEIWTKHASLDTANKFVGAIVYVISGGASGSIIWPPYASLWAYTSPDEPVIGTVTALFARADRPDSQAMTDGMILVGSSANLGAQVTPTGDVTISNTGATTIANNAVSDAKLRDSAACTVIGRAANSSGDPADITVAEGEIVSRQGNVVNGFFISDFTSDDIATADVMPFADATESGVTNSTTVSRLLGFSSSSICEGRLTLTSGTDVTTTDVTAAASIYFTPSIGDRITIYDGTRLCLYQFTELTLALGTVVNAMAYDVFVYDNAGTLTLESLEWANLSGVTMTIATPCVVTWTAHGMLTGDSITFTTSGALPTGLAVNTQYWITKVSDNTFNLSTSLITLAAGTLIATSGSQSGTHTGHHPQARQTALVRQNGAWYKTAALTRRYLGSFFTTATTTTEDSAAKRFLFNAHNRAERNQSVIEATDTWNYTTATWRCSNNSLANQIAFFLGLDDYRLVKAWTHWIAFNSTGGINYASGIGLDSTNANSAQTMGGLAGPGNQGGGALRSDYRGHPGIGYHVLQALETSAATGTTTWRGDNGLTYIQSGIGGEIWC